MSKTNEGCEHVEVQLDHGRGHVCLECNTLMVVLPAAQWAVVTGLVERWQNDPRNEPEDNHDDFGDGRGTAARECARELEQVVKEVDRG